MIVLHILVMDDTFITSPLGEGMFEKFVISILCFVDVGGEGLKIPIFYGCDKCMIS